MKIGSHVKISKGYLAAARRAKQIGANAFQYFPKNPRSLTIKAFDEIDAASCAAFCRENGLVSIAHTPYPTNLSVKEEEMREQTKRSLVNDLEIANSCGSIGVVVHFGTFKDSDPLEGYKRMIDMLNEILSGWEGTSMLLVENNAGKGGAQGTTFEELVQIRSLCDYPEKIGYCFDTCHGFASGIWNGQDWKEAEQKGLQLGYFQHLKAVHLNNSFHPLRSFKDRHANLSNGHIPLEGFKEFLASPSIRNLPLVLETPDDSGITHEEEIAFVKKLI